MQNLIIASNSKRGGGLDSAGGLSYALGLSRKSSAFTLAEVLITLGIIGVVAAMTLPSLVNRTRQKELETAFQKQYTLLQQAIMKIKYEDQMPFDRTSYTANFKKRLAQEYNATKDCGAINYNTGCVLLDEDAAFSYYKTLTGKTLDRCYFDDGGFITLDGTTFFVEQGYQSSDTGYLVSIDVNGYKKKPNLMGYDFFMFQITKEGKVLPMGADNTYWKEQREAYCSKTSSANLNGVTCAYFALTDKDYFKNLH